MRILLFLAFMVLMSGPGFSNPETIEIDSIGDGVDISKQVFVYHDEPEVEDIYLAQKLPFVPLVTEGSNLGLFDRSVWIKFRLKNNTAFNDLVLIYKLPSIDRIDFFYKDKLGKWQKVEAGSEFVFSQRKYKYPDFIFDLNLASGETGEFYIRIKSQKVIEVNMLVMREAQVQGYYNLLYLFFGMFIGIIVVMSIYNLFLYFSIHERAYIIYVAHTILIGITQSVILGFAYQYFWPNSPLLENQSMILFTSLVSIAGLLFQQEFLHTKSLAPILNKIGQIFIYVYVFIIIFNLFGNSIFLFNFMSVVQIMVVSYILYTALVLARRGYRPARFYLLAWLVLLLGIILFVFSKQGIIPVTGFTQYIMPVGSVLEVILLSFALADKINILKKEKETAQAAMIQLERANNKIIAEQNILLEKRVKQRTEELSKANEELSKAFEDLKNTQTQLVSAEKMASLGQLTAGIAHEINNPINFVSGSIEPLKRDVDDLIELFEKTQEMLGECEVAGNVLEKLEALKQEFEYDYVREEIENLLRSMKDGTERTVEIVKGLRLFSRVDESDVKKVNLHDGLDSTLILLNNMFKKYNIEVEKNYGPIPQVECYAGKINQVFINILGNAAQAIGENPEQTEPGKIVVTTRNDETHVYITIRDNGPGIPDDVKEKIFEPFFTTKPIGQGTGLGLSIVYTIIKNHAGTITVDSKPKKGTTFTIKLPIVALKEHTDGK